MRKDYFVPGSQKEVVAIQETAKLLVAAISKLDLKGTDVQVTRAISIVNEVSAAMVQRKQISSEEAYSKALCRLISGLEP